MNILNLYLIRGNPVGWNKPGSGASVGQTPLLDCADNPTRSESVKRVQPNPTKSDRIKPVRVIKLRGRGKSKYGDRPVLRSKSAEAPSSSTWPEWTIFFAKVHFGGRGIYPT